MSSLGGVSDIFVTQAGRGAVVPKACFHLHSSPVFLDRMERNPVEFSDLVRGLILEGDDYLHLLGKWGQVVENRPGLQDGFLLAVREHLPELKAQYMNVSYSHGRTRWDNYVRMAQDIPFLRTEIDFLELKESKNFTLQYLFLIAATRCAVVSELESALPAGVIATSLMPQREVSA